jgi:general secretion pathway protein J
MSTVFVQPRRARGFTLLEMLLVVMLLALLIGGAYSGIHAATKAMHAGERAIDRADRLRTSQEFLRHQLTRILPLAYAADRSNGTNTVFEGDAHRMRFVAPMPGYLSRGGPYVQVLELVNGRDGMELRFDDEMLNGFELEKSNTRNAAPIVLFDKIRSGRFEYRALDDQGKLGNWSSNWDDPGTTPLVIRIELAMQPDVQLPWPTLDVPLMVNAGAIRPGIRQIQIRSPEVQ